jgi:hypothetical protein
MLRLFDQVVSRGWVVFLAGWFALVVGTQLGAPPWEEVAQDKQTF